jgi:hypothetical protein
LVVVAVVEEMVTDSAAWHLKLAEAVVVLLDDFHRREQQVHLDKEMLVHQQRGQVHTMEVVVAVQVHLLHLEQGV